MRKNFGGVSVKLLYSVLLLIFISGCEAQQTSVSALKLWDDQFQACTKAEQTSEAIFPRTEWFDSLNKDEQIKVVMYIYNKKKRDCIEPYATNLKEALQREDIQSLITFFNSLGAFKGPDINELSSIDLEQVAKLEKNTELFNLRRVGKQLGF